MQTMLASVVRHTLPDIEYTREVFTFKDGGQVGLDWTREGYGDPSKPIVLILPGKFKHQPTRYLNHTLQV